MVCIALDWHGMCRLLGCVEIGPWYQPIDDVGLISIFTHEGVKMFERKRVLGSLIAAAAIAIATSASAASHNEVGDAGQLPGTAQNPAGAGALSSISGKIATGSDVDMYRIILNGGAFGATTVGTPGTLGDTQLYLFNASGIGVLANDDDPGGTTLRSTISGSLPSGTYYLAISSFDADPISAGGLIFPSAPFTGLFGPSGPGGGQAISGWSGSGGDGTYTIELRGACAAPEPGSLALLATGALPLLRRLRRRREA
jgi:hypothetical protein